MKKGKEIKVKVVYSEGFRKRITESCLQVLERREAMENLKGATTTCMQKSASQS